MCRCEPWYPSPRSCFGSRRLDPPPTDDCKFASRVWGWCPALSRVPVWGVCVCVYACSVLILPLGTSTVPLGTAGSISLCSLRDSPPTVKGRSGERAGAGEEGGSGSFCNLPEPELVAGGTPALCCGSRSSLCPPGRAQGGLAVNTS